MTFGSHRSLRQNSYLSLLSLVVTGFFVLGTNPNFNTNAPLLKLGGAFFVKGVQIEFRGCSILKDVLRDHTRLSTISQLFPRFPVVISREIQKRMKNHKSYRSRMLRSRRVLIHTNIFPSLSFLCQAFCPSNKIDILALLLPKTQFQCKTFLLNHEKTVLKYH